MNIVFVTGGHDPLQVRGDRRFFSVNSRSLRRKDRHEEHREARERKDRLEAVLVRERLKELISE